MNLGQLFGLIIILISAGLILYFWLLDKPGRFLRGFRPMPGFQRLRRAIGLSVEQGNRLHISLGKASLVNPAGASSLAALAALERIARMSSLSDRPPIASSGDGALAILSQDAMRSAYRLSNSPELHDPDRGRLAGATPLSFLAGMLPLVHGEHVSAHVLLGNFGSEIALLAEAANQKEQFTLAASDSLTAQAVLYATAQEPLIGEELFAVSAYLLAGPQHTASLRVHDLLRLGVIAAILILVILSLAGVL
ncbi:MAG TPA: hypothetical protein PKN11_02645 [Anaerolineaceae bacterium]|nr:hypothetical protein [Anaerolineaceae bacterium]HNZ01700.1 hypothetical protein [Anaerolineaceae bacterium]HOD43643.1 hypothetical protein [Anaerolineaceae bacterium]HOH20838.1 hypothetical protein [Anaerolineaceae bacterium]HPA33644.1 hypothetical protein [Anaerolineaceae bacterium]